MILKGFTRGKELGLSVVKKVAETNNQEGN